MPTLDSSSPPSFRALYRNHFGFVWSSSLRMGVPLAAVEDAVQDVFVVAHRRLSSFEGRSSIRSWLFAIVRRVAFRYRRSAERADRKHRALAREPRPRPQIDEWVEQRQRSALLLRALDELDRDKRAALSLHVFDELSGPQVAEILGLNLDTAYSRIKAGRRALQCALERKGVRERRAELVAAVAQETRPPPDARRKVAALLALRLGARPVLLAIPSALVWKGVCAAIVFGTVALLGAGLAAHDNPSSPTANPTATTAVENVDEPLPSSTHSPPPQISAAPPHEAQELRPRRPHPAPRDRSAPAPSHGDQLRREVELITSAKAAIDRNDSSRALELLSDHARDFERGQLVMERQAYRAIALCELGHTTRGHGEARIFLRKHPEVTLARRVAQACEASPPSW